MGDYYSSQPELDRDFNSSGKPSKIKVSSLHSTTKSNQDNQSVENKREVSSEN